MSDPTTAVTQQSQPATIRGLMDTPKFRAEVAKLLPSIITPERFIRVACNAIQKVPKLADCDQVSFFNAMLQCAQYGLEPDGRRAHLIPYGTTCTLIIDYKGIVELAMRSGLVANLHADVVCEADAFEVDRGDIKKHTVNYRLPRGPVYAVYAICRFKDGTEKADVMSVDEVEAIRKRSRAGTSGPWVTDWNEMAKKTVFRRLSKWLTLTPEFRDAVEADDESIASMQTVQAVVVGSKPNLKEEVKAETKTEPPAQTTPPSTQAPPTATETPPAEEKKPKVKKEKAPPVQEAAATTPPPANVVTLPATQAEPVNAAPQATTTAHTTANPGAVYADAKSTLEANGIPEDRFLYWLAGTGRYGIQKTDGSMDPVPNIEAVPIEKLIAVMSDARGMGKCKIQYGKPS